MRTNYQNYECHWPLGALLLIVVGIILQAQLAASAAEADYRALAPPVVEGPWIRPAAGRPAQPLWGHAEGLRIGLAPLPGPRGLLRVYAPYLGHPSEVMINFIAIEPIAAGEKTRGLSELEFSQLDDVQGKRFWTADDLADWSPRDPEFPAQGVIERIDGVEWLRVYVLSEPFDNGANVAVRLTFRADRPHEVGIATYRHANSAALGHCIVTATMGNYARLRQLHLAQRVVASKDLWPDYSEDGFTPHAQFSLNDMRRTVDGEAVVTATTDEEHPQEAEYQPSTASHWRYEGKTARQTWRMAQPSPHLKAQVNSRFVYWHSRAQIPGGISFENFELVSPFEQGEEFWFGVQPMETIPVER